jgi:hypothetical protein
MIRLDMLKRRALDAGSLRQYGRKLVAKFRIK